MRLISNSIGAGGDTFIKDSNSWVYVNYGQQKANGGSASSFGARYTACDTVGVATDADSWDSVVSM